MHHYTDEIWQESPRDWRIEQHERDVSIFHIEYLMCCVNDNLLSNRLQFAVMISNTCIRYQYYQRLLLM